MSVADETWRKGFVHLTVDGDGLVSLWDYEQERSHAVASAQGSSPPVPGRERRNEPKGESACSTQT